MLAAIITLSLLSLLVATEADPSGAHSEPSGDQPLRPSPGPSDRHAGEKTKRLAA